ncbi:hypothetical protein ONS95_011963 [Cadophora gregata]|uniref:uncharacterized protein n=1 Tax=Cadophora gregata TaxID=51156 RepID=UPI0026DB066D|nr:uncharacterized protein ONS95_011963 [Cadophora gregata]KAK0117631.1 hypothetical protein ONS95_011963 [Cadophora gregata]KAK0122679.1 hypothetical protein ONS96_009716 [Cadophora gregata f. sp. sojae]
MSKSESDSKVAAAVEDDDEPDEWDKRIFSTGCAGESCSLRTYISTASHADTAENTKMTDCYWEKKDWRLCKDEVRKEAFSN